MKVRRSAPGKIFLCGEYMATEGGKATLLSANRSVEVLIERNHTNDNRLYTSALKKDFIFRINDRSEIEWIGDNPKKYGAIFDIALKVLKVKPSNESFSILSSGFFQKDRKIGIGSSSAIAVAITRSINKYYSLNLDEKEELYSSIEIHRAFQKYKGSGLDVVTSYIGAPIIECSRSEVETYEWKELRMPEGIHIGFIKGNDSANTREMLTRFEIGKRDKAEFFKEISREMKESLNELSDAFEEGCQLDILKNLKRYSTLMIEMDNTLNIGIYTQADKEASLLAEEQGILYKPSGAGGGDLGLIISDEKASFDQYLENLMIGTMRPIELIKK